MSYQRDTEVELKGTFTDLTTDALADPDEVTLEVRSPAGTVTTYLYSENAVTRSSAGVYVKLITLSASGVWYYRFKGAGTVTVAGWKRLDVIDDPLN